MIIALVGKQLSGKTTVARIIEFIYGYKRLDLAKPLKEYLAKELECVEKFSKFQSHYLQEIEQNKDKYRHQLIAYGKLLREQKGEDILIKLALKDYKPEDRVIIENCRTLAEYNCLKSFGATFIKVESDRTLRESRGSLVCEEDKTETELDHLDFVRVIRNYTNNFDELIIETIDLFDTYSELKRSENQ